MVSNPNHVATSSALELGKMVGSSDATVIRTARSLGYRGYTDLRKSLSEGEMVRTAADILTNRLFQSSDDNEFRTAIRHSLGLLNELESVTTETTWENGLQLLSRANHIWTIGFGPAATLADFLALSLSRIGLRSNSFTNTGFRLADDLLKMSKDDAVVIFAPVRFFREMDAALERAHEVGVSTVVISETLGMKLQNRVDVIISTPETNRNSASELLAGLVVSHAFALSLAKVDQERSRRLLQELNLMRERVAGPDLDAI
jgi:DNA-binding MurR/RpiR family transcriptional regulator